MVWDRRGQSPQGTAAFRVSFVKIRDASWRMPPPQACMWVAYEGTAMKWTSENNTYTKPRSALDGFLRKTFRPRAPAHILVPMLRLGQGTQQAFCLGWDSSPTPRGPFMRRGEQPGLTSVSVRRCKAKLCEDSSSLVCCPSGGPSSTACNQPVYTASTKLPGKHLLELNLHCPARSGVSNEIPED